MAVGQAWGWLLAAGRRRSASSATSSPPPPPRHSCCWPRGRPQAPGSHRSRSCARPAGSPPAQRGPAPGAAAVAQRHALLRRAHSSSPPPAPRTVNGVQLVWRSSSRRQWVSHLSEAAKLGSSNSLCWRNRHDGRRLSAPLDNASSASCCAASPLAVAGSTESFGGDGTAGRRGPGGGRAGRPASRGKRSLVQGASPAEGGAAGLQGCPRYLCCTRGRPGHGDPRWGVVAQHGAVRRQGCGGARLVRRVLHTQRLHR